MEDALRDSSSCTMWMKATVLILVLMEDALRDYQYDGIELEDWS